MFRESSRGLGVMEDGESTQSEAEVASTGTAGSAFSCEELETLIAEAVARALASRCGESPGESSIERGVSCVVLHTNLP